MPLDSVSIPRNFNSTMVRLKVILSFGQGYGVLFQFHYGSIKGLRPVMNGIFLDYFNSTMVRLKGNHENHTSGCILVFQFHYGSIKGYRIEALDTMVKIFQFHYGSIKGRSTISKK